MQHLFRDQRRARILQQWDYHDRFCGFSSYCQPGLYTDTFPIRSILTDSTFGSIVIFSLVLRLATPYVFFRGARVGAKVFSRDGANRSVLI